MEGQNRYTKQKEREVSNAPVIRIIEQFLYLIKRIEHHMENDVNRNMWSR